MELLEALKIKDNFCVNKGVQSVLLKDTTNSKVHPKVSICIPTFRRTETLKAAIESCLNQRGFEEFDIIVCDNNPERNDETELFFQSYECERIKYYKHESSLGMYGNINRCVELSDAEFTVVLHDDDLLLPHFLRISYFVLKNNNIDILYPNSLGWDCNSDPLPEEQLGKTTYLYRNKIEDCALTCPHPPTGMVFRTKSIIDLGGFDLETYPSSDYYFCVKAFSNLKVYTMHQPLYIYRWGVNATLKLDTILGFIKADIPLKRYIVERVGFLKAFWRLIMIVYSEYKKRQLSVFPDFPNETVDGLIHNSSAFEKRLATLFNGLYKYILAFKHYLGREKINLESLVV